MIFLMTMPLLIFLGPASAALCCANKCYLTGECCNDVYYPGGCYAFKVVIYGPDNYIVAEPTELIVQVKNEGIYSDSYTLAYKVVDGDGNPDLSGLIGINSAGADHLELVPGATGFVAPLVTVMSTSLDDRCINVTATSTLSGDQMTANTCIINVQAEVSLPEILSLGAVMVIVSALLIFTVKKKKR